MKKQKIMIVFGTRPEAIKMAPLVKAFQCNDNFETIVCVTAQHREMLDQVLYFFDIVPDYDLDLMKKNQTLTDVTCNVLKGLEPILENEQPDLLFVQGDTTTVVSGALAAFYKKIKVAHLEAGLRTGDKFSPWPEEINRRLTGQLADYHFAPTQRPVDNLRTENIEENVFNVGNTVIDALFLGLELIQKNGEEHYSSFFEGIDFSKRVILITGHRRESFGKPFENMCRAIKDLSVKNQDVEFVYPVHLNPNVRKTVNEFLGDQDNIHLIEPLDYPLLIWLMNKSYLVLTDSGGIQEEAPSLGKPVLVMREVTERQEGIEAGTAKLVGTNYEKIIYEVNKLLYDDSYYSFMANAVNPYGDGTTSEKIVKIISEVLL